MASSNVDVDDYCRLCAVESQSGVIIYSTEGERLCLEEKILTCLRIEVKNGAPPAVKVPPQVSRDDMLPKRVCQSCSILLEDLYRFSERAAQVQHTLYFLFGLHLSHSEEETNQLCLIGDGVKVESNAIKKELDEFVIHQGDVLVPTSLHVTDDRHDTEESQPQKVTLTPAGNVDQSGNGKHVAQWEKERQGLEVPHLKILLPKKSVQEKEVKLKEIDCFIEEIISTQAHDITGENINDQELYKSTKGLADSSLQDYDEEEKTLLAEWKKNWGIICCTCQTLFHEGSQNEDHYCVLHNKNPIYTCSFCKKCVESSTIYKVHILQHIYNGRFRCTFCSKNFCTQRLLEVHSSVSHGERIKHICSECGKSANSQQRLEAHVKSHMRPKSTELECNECGKVLQTKAGLAGHKSVHKLGRHFMCHICGKTFTQKANMQQHVKHHKGERPHSCEICQKSFTEKSHLNRHKSFHALDRPFQCTICSKTYKTERCLKVHSQIHGNSRPYICTYCGKGFLSSTKLKQHHNCHTGERPYACKYCDRTFTNYPNWLKHTRRRHKVDHKTGLRLKTEGTDRETFEDGPCPDEP